MTDTDTRAFKNCHKEFEAWFTSEYPLSAKYLLEKCNDGGYSENIYKQYCAFRAAWQARARDNRCVELLAAAKRFISAIETHGKTWGVSETLRTYQEREAAMIALKATIAAFEASHE